MKKFLSILLACIMLIGMMSVVSAADADKGTAGDNITWEVTGDHLYFRGKGEIADFNPKLGEEAPWIKYLHDVTTIVFEEGITAIGDNNILYFSQTVDIYLPSTLKSIGGGNFSSLDSLEEITIPDSVTTIGDEVLKNCDKLKSVKIGKNITTIGKEFLLDSPYHEENMGADGVVYLNNYLIGCKNPQNSISVKPGTTLIANYVFYKKTTITDVTFPDSLKYIGEYAFSYDDKLNTVTFPQKLESIGQWAFASCRGFESIILPDSVKYVGNAAFCACVNAKELKLSSSMTEIKGSFSNCGMSSLVIPDNIKTIDEAAFLHCRKLETLVIGDGVESTGTNDFEGCISLKKIHFGKNFKTFGLWAFRELPALTEITVNESSPYLTVMEGNLYSKDMKTMYLYAKGKPDATFIVPLSVTTLHNSVFAFSNNLTEIILHNRLETIGENCMQECKNLARVTIPDSVTEIKHSAFRQCYNLLTIELGRGIKKIADEAFSASSAYGRKVYYAGTPEEWAAISIGSHNDKFYDVICNTPAANPVIYVKLNGEYIDFSKYGQNPVIENGRTLVPLRSVFEALGASVEWDGATSTVTSVRGNVTVKLTINIATIYVNGEAKTLDVAPKILNGRTMVPLRAVVEAFGCQIGWDGTIRTASITA